MTAGAADIPALLARLREIYPLLQREAEDSERLRRPTPAVQEALRDTGIFRLMVPTELAGLDATPTQILQVTETLSHADASLGWLVRALTGETATAAAYLSDEAVAGLFAGDTYPLVGGQSTSLTGRAVRAAGGYKVSGTWQFAPGVSMATHLNLAAVAEETDDAIVCLVPRAALRISDNWDMLGLRATASLDYRAEDVFVEDRYVFRIGRQYARRGGTVVRLGPALLVGLQQAAWSQGVGRRMLDELRDLSGRRDPAQGSPVTSEEFFGEFARQFSHARGTMALLNETWRDIEQTLAGGARPNGEQETMARLASTLATRTALEISQFVHHFAGAQIMRNGALQRFFRDTHAGSQHRGSSHTVRQKCGRMLLGALPPGSHWGFFDLVVSGETA